MTKPYIACHMMMSVDGRIDCAMTSKLKGVDEYYQTLSALNVPTTVSGRITAEIEMAEGIFEPESTNVTPYGKEGFSKKTDAQGYDVVIDSKGTLLWPNQAGAHKPILVVMSKQVTYEYLDYLDSQNISWIVAGETHPNLAKAAEVLATEFGVERMAVVGGGNINAAFLAAGLLDEVSILLGPGIDARAGMASTFDGLAMNSEPFQIKLKSVESYADGAIWIRYTL